MPANPPTLYVIAGCNGAGKTTFATEFLPHAGNCLRFLNPDEIARGLSPLNPPAANVKAARILLREIHDAVQHRETFAIGNYAERTKLRPTPQESSKLRAEHRRLNLPLLVFKDGRMIKLRP